MESGKPTQIPNYTQLHLNSAKTSTGEKSSNQTGAGLLSLESEEEEDSDSSSSSSSIDLETFRQIWKKEINQKKIIKDNKVQDNDGSDQEKSNMSRWNMAKSLYKQGTRLEKAGELFLATQHYRQALKLEPEIDLFPMDDEKDKKQTDSGSKASKCVRSTESEALEGFHSLLEKFASMRINQRSCLQEMVSKETGIHDLPPEVIMYILRWVVGRNLDIISLENLSLVNRGFYVLSRDEELWHSICIRIWGRHCDQQNNPPAYRSWRDMACNRPRLAFNGCYLSRNTYVRCGEPTLGISYSPFYLVEYFRAYRFYPDGQAVAINSPDSPALLLKALANQNNQRNFSGLLIGYYLMEGRKVTCVLHRATDDQQEKAQPKRFGKRKPIQELVEHTYRMEFQIKRSRGKPFQILAWKSYIIVTRRGSGVNENVSECEIPSHTFPPLQFSRVKSYEVESELQPL